MKRVTPFFLLVALSALTAMPAATYASAQSRPTGVSSSAWVPVTKNLGFVIEKTTLEPGPKQVTSAFGYFVVQRDGHWLRLDSIPHGALFGGPETSALSGTRWVSITKNLGFAIERRMSERGSDQVGSVLGHFEVKRGGQWLRLSLIPHGVLFRGPLTANRSEVPLAKHLIFVIEQPASEHGVEQIPSALGYFVVQRGIHRIRLDSIPQGALFRMPL
jgi:hypothetical protein